MYTRSIASKSISSLKNTSAPQPAAAQDELARIFNTVLVSTQTDSKRDFSAELYALTESASFSAILSSVRNLARVQGISERQAAEQVIQTFRKLDEVWGDYLYREGIDRIRQPR